MPGGVADGCSRLDVYFTHQVEPAYRPFALQCGLLAHSTASRLHPAVGYPEQCSCEAFRLCLILLPYPRLQFGRLGR